MSRKIPIRASLSKKAAAAVLSGLLVFSSTPITPMVQALAEEVPLGQETDSNGTPSATNAPTVPEGNLGTEGMGTNNSGNTTPTQQPTLLAQSNNVAAQNDPEPTNSAVAKIGEKEYATLQAAIDDATEGSTITLLSDVELTDMITLKKSLTIDLAGKKLSRNDGNSLVQVIDNKTLTINGTTENSEVYGRINLGIKSNNNGSAVLNGGAYTCASGNTVLHINGTCKASNVTIKDATITSPDDNAIQLNGSGEFNISNSKITGATGIYIKSGKLNLTNSEITGNKNPVDYSYNGNGANATGDAIVVDSCFYPGGAPTVTIGEGNKFSATKSQVGYYQYPKNGSTQDATITANPESLTLTEGYAWVEDGDHYKVAAAVATVDGVGYPDFGS